MSFNNKIQSKYIIYTLFLFAIYLASLQFLSQKPVVLDGARFLIQIQKGDLFPYDGWHRYSTLLWQIITGLIAYPFDGVFRHELIRVTYNFFYTFHPLISVLICHSILPKDKKEVILFPLLTYFLATLPAMSFPGSHVVETASYFWPFLFLVIYRGQNNLNSILIFVLGLLIIFSYMQALGLLYLSTIYLYFIREDRTIKKKLLLSLSIIGTLFYIYKWFYFIGISKKDNLTNQFTQIIESRMYIVYIPSVIFILQFIMNTFKKIKYINLYFIPVYLLASFYIFKHIEPRLYMGFYFRLSLIPIIGMILIGYFCWSEKEKKQKQLKGVIYFSLFPILICSYFDIHTSLKLKEGFHNLSNMLAEYTGCHYIDKKIYFEKLGRYGLNPDFLILHSIIFGGPNINTILYTSTNGFWNDDNYPQIATCKSPVGKNILVYRLRDVNFSVSFWDNKYFNSEKIFNELISNRVITHNPGKKTKYISFEEYSNKSAVILHKDIKNVKIEYRENKSVINGYLIKDGIKIKGKHCMNNKICFSNIEKGNYELVVDLKENEHTLISEYFEE